MSYLNLQFKVTYFLSLGFLECFSTISSLALVSAAQVLPLG